MTTAQEASKRYTENSLSAFLKGKGTENWIIGVLGASNAKDIAETLMSLSSSYSNSNTERFDFLRRTYGVA